MPRGREVGSPAAELGREDRCAAGETTVAAGVTLGAVQEVARQAGSDVGVDLGAATARRSAAWSPPTPAACRSSAMGRCASWSASKGPADGSVLRRLPGLLKDNTGYHLAGLLAGTRAPWR